MNLRPVDVENCDMGACAKSWFYTQWGRRVYLRQAEAQYHTFNCLEKIAGTVLIHPNPCLKRQSPHCINTAVDDQKIFLKIFRLIRNVKTY